MHRKKARPPEHPLRGVVVFLRRPPGLLARQNSLYLRQGLAPGEDARKASLGETVDGEAFFVFDIVGHQIHVQAQFSGGHIVQGVIAHHAALRRRFAGLLQDLLIIARKGLQKVELS